VRDTRRQKSDDPRSRRTPDWGKRGSPHFRFEPRLLISAGAKTPSDACGMYTVARREARLALSRSHRDEYEKGLQVSHAMITLEDSCSQ